MKTLHYPVLLFGIVLLFSQCKKPESAASEDTLSDAKLSTNALGTKPNVLFIIVDDLRYWSIKRLYEEDDRKPNIIPYTPNMDALINDPESVTFTNAHAPGIACTPSRTAFLSGKYPNETGIYRNLQDWASAININETLFAAFREDPNYRLYGAGKIFHDGADQARWVLGDGQTQSYYDDRFKVTKSRYDDSQVNAGLYMGFAGYKYRYQRFPEDDPSPDQNAASFCIDKMAEMKNNHPNKSFFITCGLRQPHNPYIIKQEYVNAVEEGNYPKSVSRANLPAMAQVLADCGPATSPDQMKQNHAADWKNYLGAYRGSVRMLDEQIGRLLDGLQTNGFKNNTIVVLISDHGFHLGEKNHVQKNTMWEETTRVPMIWRVPGKSNAFCNTAVDLMSIYPTLKQYCNLSKSLMSVAAKPLNGLIDNPSSGTEGDFALTVAAGDLGGNQNKILASVQTRDWRLIKYVINSNASNTEELYQNSTDTWEEFNLRPNPTPAIEDRLTTMRNKITSRMIATAGAESRGTINPCQ